jgi:thiol-disulfide isomerase/thioredoxin
MNDRVFRFAGAVLVVIVGIWAGARIHSSRMASNPAVEVATPVGEASPPIPSDLMAESAPQPARIPDRLPEFSLEDLQGKPTPINTWSGKSLVINFWATWCAPCRREIPLLEELSSHWADRGVQILGIAVDHRDAVTNYARELRIEYPILIGEQDALDVATSLGFDSPWESCTGPRRISFSPWSKTSIRLTSSSKMPAALSPKVFASSRPANPVKTLPAKFA